MGHRFFYILSYDVGSLLCSNTIYCKVACCKIVFDTGPQELFMNTTLYRNMANIKRVVSVIPHFRSHVVNGCVVEPCRTCGDRAPISLY